MDDRYRPFILLGLVIMLFGFVFIVRRANERTVGAQPPPTERDVRLLAPAGSIPSQTFRPVSATAQREILDYPHFTVGYDNQRKNPAWVVYALDGPITHPGHEAKRPLRFATDPRSPAHVRHEDYDHSGFDRGLLCPSYALFSRLGEASEDEAFVMTNVIPQVHSLLAVEQEDLEEHIAGRDRKRAGWATTMRHLTIINGPVCYTAPRFQPSGIQIPDFCFSIVIAYDTQWQDYQSVAFLMPNGEGVIPSLTHYRVTKWNECRTILRTSPPGKGSESSRGNRA